MQESAPLQVLTASHVSLEEVAAAVQPTAEEEASQEPAEEIAVAVQPTTEKQESQYVQATLRRCRGKCGELGHKKTRMLKFSVSKYQS